MCIPIIEMAINTVLRFFAEVRNVKRQNVERQNGKRQNGKQQNVKRQNGK
jgi:hypothetical protein